MLGKTRLGTSFLLIQTIQLGLSTGCAIQPSPPYSPLSKPVPAAATVQQQARTTPLSGKAWLEQALKAGQNWANDAELTGVYALQLGGEAFLSYEFQSPQRPEQNLFVKIQNNGQMAQRQTQAQGRNQALPLAQWLLSAQDALKLAQQHGFQAQDNFGVGLNYWQGMGIPQASLKWSVLSFADSEAREYFVIDASTAQVWRCQPTTQPNTGCAPTEIISKLKNAQ